MDGTSIWSDLYRSDPDFRRKMDRARRRAKRGDLLRALRHRILPFLHDWRGPYGDDAKCHICQKRVPMTSVDNWRGRLGLHA